MILGRITGKLTTNEFDFLVEGKPKKFDYVQVYHKDYEYVLCQIVELERTVEGTIAKCIVIGANDDQGRVRPIRTPFEPKTEVLLAEDAFVKSIIKLDMEGAFVGKLEGRDILISLDLNKLLTKHIAILAKSGAGKSYTVGVLLEEMIDKKIPVIVIDPHGEYSSLKEKNEDKDDSSLMERYGIKPAALNENISEWGDHESGLNPILLNELLTPAEIIDLLPGKISNNQKSLLFTTLNNLKKVTFDNLLIDLEAQQSNLKWGLINTLSYLRSTGLFSSSPTDLNELIKPGRCSIINLKGTAPELQEIIVYKLLSDLFEARKKEDIPPFFAVIEEAHNFVPERGFGESKCSSIIKTIASEGRKFGLGLGVVSQRPAMVQKTVLSQCTTQIILKVTNPNDLKAITGSVEGITSESEKEVRNLPVGTALITGIVDIPLFVSVRPRKTAHGGRAVDIIPKTDFKEKVKEYSELLPLLLPNVSREDVALMSETDSVIKTRLIPSVLFKCDEKFSILMDRTTGRVITDIDMYKTKELPDFNSLKPEEISILKALFQGEKASQGPILEGLIKKGYVEGDMSISDDYIFSSLSNHAVHKKIEFQKLPFDKKLDALTSIDDLKEKISNFIRVDSEKECFLVNYSPDVDL